MGEIVNKNNLKDKLEEFIVELKYSEKAENTFKKYKVDVCQFINSIEHENDINKDDVIKYKREMMESKFKPSTINSKIISINKFLKYVGLNELLVKQLKIQKTNSLNEVMTPIDYKRLLRTSKKNGDNQLYLIMKILASTGIRFSELKYFTVEKLDYYIEVNNKGKIRNIIVRQDLYREIKKYCRENNIKGKLINKSTVWRRMKKIAGIASVKKSLVHARSFRHLFAVLYLEQNNNNVLELADILGHESLDTTRIYTRSTDELKRKKLEKMKF